MDFSPTNPCGTWSMQPLGRYRKRFPSPSNGISTTMKVGHRFSNRPSRKSIRAFRQSPCDGKSVGFGSHSPHLAMVILVTSKSRGRRIYLAREASKLADSLSVVKCRHRSTRQSARSPSENSVCRQSGVRNRIGTAGPPQNAEATDPNIAWRRVRILVEKSAVGRSSRWFSLRSCPPRRRNPVEKQVQVDGFAEFNFTKIHGLTGR